MSRRTELARILGRLALASAALPVVSCGNGGGSTEPTPDAIAVQSVASGLSNPLYLTAPSGDARLFVVEKGGRVKIVRDGALLPTPFLDISSKVSNGSEQGLLSIAFHPAYATSGFFYVSYTDVNGDTRVERYHASPSADVAEAGSSTPVLFVDQPFSNHNGGLLLFGPDGKLYFGLGDGGSGGDPQGNGQNRATLLGKILRLDVDGAQPYAVPSDNPFVGQTGARGEIWAYGLRNPWRFAFDRVAGTLYVADVGQGALEEVNVVAAGAKGLNYGWNVMEGSTCFNATTCDRSGLTLPIVDYDHSGGACSVTGGLVYRGSAIPGLQGTYFYSDYCAGFLRSVRWNGSEVTEEKEWSVGTLGSVLSFGEDASGELYILSGNGNVYKIVPST